MRPIAIFRHSRTVGPGYFAIFLERRGIPWRLIPIDAGINVPDKPDAYSGLCFAGGPMSVNDPLPWIPQVCNLIRQAHTRGIPVIGHCLGGQLISKAFGATVGTSPAKEVGWGVVHGCAGSVATRWLGDLETPTVFQWHGDTFELPLGASLVLRGDYCTNQAFALGPHLAMQFHVEMLPETIRQWCQGWQKDAGERAKVPPCVQTPEQMLMETATRLPVMRKLADRLYSSWIAGLRR